MLKLALDAHKKVSERKKYVLRPRHQWVLIRKTTPEEYKTEEGVVVSMETARSSEGIVVEAGPDVADLKPGDKVLFSNFGMELEDVELLTGEKDLFLVRDEEVYSRMEECE